MLYNSSVYFFFFFNDTATTEIYTLSLHDALPIRTTEPPQFEQNSSSPTSSSLSSSFSVPDRKSTRLNSSHGSISYAVFCLNKKTYVSAWSRELYADGARHTVH